MDLYLKKAELSEVCVCLALLEGHWSFTGILVFCNVQKNISVVDLEAFLVPFLLILRTEICFVYRCKHSYSIFLATFASAAVDDRWKCRVLNVSWSSRWEVSSPEYNKSGVVCCWFWFGDCFCVSDLIQAKFCWNQRSFLVEGAELGPSFLVTEMGIACFYGNISSPAIAHVLGMLYKTQYLPVGSSDQYKLGWLSAPIKGMNLI